MKKQTVVETFRKMRRRGVIVPTLDIIDKTTKSVSSIYELNLDRLEKEVMNNLSEYSVNHKDGKVVKDSIEGLVSFLESSGKGFTNKIIGNIETIINFDDKYHYDKLKKRLSVQFGKTADHFFKDLFEDADPKLVDGLYRFKLDKSDVFETRIDDIKQLYLNNAIDRIKGEQDDLKKRFLTSLTDWISGDSDKLDVKDFIKEMKKTSVNEARFFARDQLGKFNKAILIASFRAAGVKSVMLKTVKDQRVRDDHRKWNDKVFLIDNIPQAWFDDYNCRCGAVPVEYYD